LSGKENLEDVAVSTTAGRVALAGGNTVKLVDMSSGWSWKEVKGESAVVEAGHGPIDSLAWTADGQIVTVATRSGHVYGYLARLPSLVDACGPRVAYMSSLREVAVAEHSAGLDDVEPAAPLLRIPIQVQQTDVNSFDELLRDCVCCAG
jgi:hypothetical protein